MADRVVADDGGRRPTPPSRWPPEYAGKHSRRPLWPPAGGCHHAGSASAVSWCYWSLHRRGRPGAVGWRRHSRRKTPRQTPPGRRSGPPENATARYQFLTCRSQLQVAPVATGAIAVASRNPARQAPQSSGSRRARSHHPPSQVPLRGPAHLADCAEGQERRYDTFCSPGDAVALDRDGGQSMPNYGSDHDALHYHSTLS